MTLKDSLDEINRFSKDGEVLSAIDAARDAGDAAAEAGRDEDAALIRIQEVTLLARMGAASEAQEKFTEYKLADAAGTRGPSLHARLQKDLAFAEGDRAERRKLFLDSRDRYLKICRNYDPAAGDSAREQFDYNGINAVTLHHLAEALRAENEKDAGQAEIAKLTAELGALPPLETYYSWATRAELLLNEGRPVAEIRDALANAIGKTGDGFSSRATTLRQLERIEPGHEALNVLRPGPALHYSGHMISAPGAEKGRVLAKNEAILTARIHETFDQIAPSVTFGSLASGADIIIVEAALKRGLEARVYLPFAREDFFTTSIDPAGGDWADRARACLDHPLCHVSYLSEGPNVEGDVLCYGLVARYAMGAAIVHADYIGGRAEQLLVWDGIETYGAAGAAADRRHWLAAGRQPHWVDVCDLGVSPPSGGPPRRRALDRTSVALVFGDVKNFSKLSEAQLPIFVDEVMGTVSHALGDVTKRYGHTALSFRNTWGDGVFAVFPEASAAAFFALSLQNRMAALDFEKLGLPKELAIRLGLHYGAAYERVEPVTGLRNFFGEAVARAARVEPVTKAGRVFTTHEFAAELALDPESPAQAEYVGMVPTAKNYGVFRLFGLVANERFLRV